jgi:hypothetical protein
MHSFLLGLFSFVKIDNLPSLVLATMSLVNNDLSSLFIFSTFNIKAFVVLDV